MIATDQAGVDAIVIRSDAQLYGCLLDAGKTVEHALKPHRSGWLQLVSGELDVNGVDLSAGDGVAVTNEAILNIAAIHKSEFVFYDIAEA